MYISFINSILIYTIKVIKNKNIYSNKRKKERKKKKEYPIFYINDKNGHIK